MTVASNKSEEEPKKAAGRPPLSEGEDVRSALLATAERLFSEKGYSSTSIRKLADAADVTPAMIHYYFGSKRGLYESLVTGVVGRVLQRITEVVEDGLPDEDRITALVDTFTSIVLEEPWLPSIVIREVLLNESGMREVFVEQYASRMAVLLPSVISDEVRQHHFREDLDPRYAFMSLLGMMAFPFMARPVFEEVLDMTYDENFRNDFTKHTAKLFSLGVLKTRE